MRWIDELVIGHKLCPWAREARRSKGFRTITVDAAEDFEEIAAREAATLACNLHQRPTTLLLLDSEATQPDAQAFARICARANSRAQSSVPHVDLLGFHPARIDTGPGCRVDPADAAHYRYRWCNNEWPFRRLAHVPFSSAVLSLTVAPLAVVVPAAAASVRAPVPTIQLLLREDLDAARSEWKTAHASSLPGALGLLYENKRRLRTLGSRELGRMLRSWRAAAGALDASQHD